MKIRIYNDVFSFEEKLDPYGSASEWSEMFLDYPEINCKISDLNPLHPVVSWMECIGQGSLSNLFYVINFTHIEFTK